MKKAARNLIHGTLLRAILPSRTEDLISAKKRGRYLFINSKNERIKLF